MADPTYNYLDYDGLALYDEKIKQLIGTKVDKDGSKVLSTNDYTTEEKNKLAGVTAGAEPNQNAFSTVSVDGTSLSADSKTDTLTITAGENVTLTPTASNDSFTIAATDTTYPEATATTGGVLTDAQAVKLNGIATGATKNTASTTTPKMDGTAAVGTETTYAKGDHVHPTDTSRAPAIHTHTSTDINSSQVTSVALADDDLIAIFDASDGSKLKPSTISGTYFPKPSSSNPLMDGTASAGTGTAYSRANHVHPTDTSRAPLNSPTFTGTPKLTTTPAAGDNSTSIASTAFVNTAITNAISGIQGISYEVVQTLPATGQAGVIYLVSNSGSAPNIYDEYIWTGTAMEKIGTTDVDLSGYQPLMTAITNAQINALFA